MPCPLRHLCRSPSDPAPLGARSPVGEIRFGDGHRCPWSTGKSPPRRARPQSQRHSLGGAGPVPRRAIPAPFAAASILSAQRRLPPQAAVGGGGSGSVASSALRLLPRHVVGAASPPERGRRRPGGGICCRPVLSRPVPFRSSEPARGSPYCSAGVSAGAVGERVVGARLPPCGVWGSSAGGAAASSGPAECPCEDFLHRMFLFACRFS